MKSKLGFCYLTAFAVLAFLIAAQSANAANTNATVTVNVNISAVGAIIVIPNSLNWTSGAGQLGSLNPGSDSLVSNLIIKNIGSVNVSNIFMNTSTIGDEHSNPLQTANALNFSAAGLIMVKNSTDALYYHAGRLEWNLSTVITNETLSLGASTTKYAHGWYRNATGNEYLWKLENGTDGFCNNTNAVFKIKSNPENVTNINRDLSTADVVTCNIADGTAWGSAPCTTGPLTGQCVATSANCDKILIYKYAGNTGGSSRLTDYPNCANSDYLRREVIVPGDEAAFFVKASVPKGMPAGDTKTGILTIFAYY